MAEVEDASDDVEDEEGSKISRPHPPAAVAGGTKLVPPHPLVFSSTHLHPLVRTLHPHRLLFSSYGIR
jgi:hypothetical protein